MTFSPFLLQSYSRARKSWIIILGEDVRSKLGLTGSFSCRLFIYSFKAHIEQILNRGSVETKEGERGGHDTKGSFQRQQNCLIITQIGTKTAFLAFFPGV